MQSAQVSQVVPEQPVKEAAKNRKPPKSRCRSFAVQMEAMRESVIDTAARAIKIVGLDPRRGGWSLPGVPRVTPGRARQGGMSISRS